MKRIAIRTYDADPRHGAVYDMVLNTNARLNAEPAPEVRAGALGVRLTGNAGAAPRQVDVNVIADSITAGLGMLTPGDLAKVKAIIARYGGSERTSQAGIT